MWKRRFNFKSGFISNRYSGKTQKQIVEFVRDNYVKRQTFQRWEFRKSLVPRVAVVRVTRVISRHIVIVHEYHCVYPPPPMLVWTIKILINEEGGTVLLLPVKHESVFALQCQVRIALRDWFTHRSLRFSVELSSTGLIFAYIFICQCCLLGQGGGESGSPSGTINPNDRCTLYQSLIYLSM